MSEWKTWSFGEAPQDPEEPQASGSQGDTPAPGAPGAPAPDEAALKWDEEVRPFDLDRLAHVLAGDGFVKLNVSIPVEREE